MNVLMLLLIKFSDWLIIIMISGYYLLSDRLIIFYGQRLLLMNFSDTTDR